MINKYGLDEQSFVWPFLLANGPNGELIVSDNSESVKQLVIFDKHLQYSRVIGGEGNGNGKFQWTCGIAVDKEGFLYATDCKLNCIQKFRINDGEFVSQFGKKGTENGEYDEPSGLTFSKLNLLFVCDRKNHRIQVLQGESFFYKFGRFSDKWEPGTFNQPVDLTLNNSEDKLFITDWGNDRVQVFTPNGQFLSQIENSPNASLKLMTPDGIFFTPDNHLLVASTNCVLIFNEDGTFVSAIEGRRNDGTWRFKDCIGIIMMNNGKIVISDGLDGDNRLMIF